MLGRIRYHIESLVLLRRLFEVFFPSLDIRYVQTIRHYSCSKRNVHLNDLGLNDGMSLFLVLIYMRRCDMSFRESGKK